MSSKKDAIFRYFSGNLKALRKAKGVTQGRVGKVVGVRQATIGAWEAGKSGPAIDQSIDLADYFRLQTVDELIRPVPRDDEYRVVPKETLLEIAAGAKDLLTKTEQVLHEPKEPKPEAAERHEDPEPSPEPKKPKRKKPKAKKKNRPIE